MPRGGFLWVFKTSIILNDVVHPLILFSFFFGLHSSVTTSDTIIDYIVNIPDLLEFPFLTTRANEALRYSCHAFRSRNYNLKDQSRWTIHALIFPRYLKGQARLYWVISCTPSLAVWLLKQAIIGTSPENVLVAWSWYVIEILPCFRHLPFYFFQFIQYCDYIFIGLLIFIICILLMWSLRRPSRVAELLVHSPGYLQNRFIIRFSLVGTLRCLS